MDPKTKRTWISILIASAIIIVGLGILLVGGTAYLVSRHVNAEFVPTEAADERFERERQRFAGQQPLIEMRRDADPILHRRTDDSRKTELQSLRALAYDASAGKLVRIDIPFWLIRLAPSGRFNFLNDEVGFDSDRVRLTLQDVERHGPGLILDTRDRKGTQVLVWTE